MASEAITDTGIKKSPHSELNPSCVDGKQTHYQLATADNVNKYIVMRLTNSKKVANKILY